VSDFASPADHLALVSTVSGLIQQFTTERAVLRQAIARLTPRSLRGSESRSARSCGSKRLATLSGRGTRSCHKRTPRPAGTPWKSHPINDSR
jgi:hypothetical protein